MATIINTKLGEHRGRKRLWLEGQKLARENCLPGLRYSVQVIDKRVVLSIGETGSYVVSKRERNGVVSPIIDLAASALAELFDGVERLRVVVKAGRIVISEHHQSQRIRARVERVLKKLGNKQPLSVASVFSGAGVMDKAIHSGMAKCGVKSRLAVAVEIEGRYLDASLRNNPELWDSESIAINSPVQDVNLTGNTLESDLAIMGIPCTGASKAGRARGRLEYAESHDAAGALFYSALRFIEAVNPVLIVMENVTSYAQTSSMVVIRAVLASWGYDVQERVLGGAEFGALENRKRMCLVAVCKGLQEVFDIDTVESHEVKQDCLSEILEPIAEDSPLWKRYEYLSDKETRDLSKGSNFRRQLLTPDAKECGCIGRGYSKARSTEPFLKHPTINGLLRLLTPVEHARVKRIPESVIAGEPVSVAHQILGQSIVYSAFEAVGVALGRFFTRLSLPATESVAA